MHYFDGIKKNTRILFFVALLFVVASGALYAMGLYMIKSKNASVRALTERLEENTRRERDIQSLRHMVAVTASERKQLDRYFVSGDDVVGFIEYIEELGKGSGTAFELSSVDVLNINPKVLQISFKAVGLWKDVVHMLALVETLPMSVEVEKTSLRKSKESESAGTDWEGNVTIRVLSFFE